MSAVPQPRYTYADYLARERVATCKSEYYGGQIFAMSGGSPQHNAISVNLTVSLRNRLRGTPCRPYNSDQRIRVPPNGLATYPDVSVVCGELRLDEEDREAIVNPVVIFEVLSKSTESYDRGKKFDLYRPLKSLRDYVLVSQDEPLVEHFARQADDTWLLTVCKGLDSTARLSGLNCELPLSEIYEDVKFGPAAAGSASRGFNPQRDRIQAETLFGGHSMSAVPQQRFTYAEYLARERVATYKSEYYGGQIFAMSGGSPQHNAISGSIFANLYIRLRGTPCRPYNSDQRIRVPPNGLATYPDVSVVCGELRLDEEDREAIVNPVVIFEVLSKSTESYDRGKKFDLYRPLKSLRDYVLVSPDEPLVEHFARQADDTWLLTVRKGLDSTVRLSGLTCELPLSEIYEDVKFAPAEAGPAS